MKRVNSRQGLRILMPTSAIVLFSFLLVLLAACGDASTTPVPASSTLPASTAAAATTAASPTTAAATTPADTTAAATTAAATTPADTSAPATTPSATAGANAGTTAKGKSLETAKGTIDSFDSSTGALAVKETSGQTTDFNASKATIVGISKISLTDFSKLSLTGMTVEFSATPGSDGSYTPTALTVLDQPAMANNAKGKGNATDAKAKGKKAGATGSTAATSTPDASTTAGTADSSRVVLHNVSLSGNTLTGTSASGTSVTVNLSDTTTLNQRVTEKASDLAAGDKLTVDYRPLGKKATGPANAVAIVIEK